MRHYGKALVQRDDNFFKTEDVYYASQGVLDIFQFPVVYGTLHNAINQPNKIALAHSTAQKMFGDDNPVGETVVVDEWLTAEVAVVYQDLPLNSHMHPKMLISMENDRSNNNMWLSNNYYTFFKLREDNNPEALVAKFDDVYPRYFGPQVEQMVGITWAEALKGGTSVHYYLQPIADIHLYSSFPVEMEANGSIENVYIFMAIGLFVLLLACINFMNLSTARASIRAKEVGIKKVLGSVKKQLVYQFLTESVLYSFLSMLIAVGLLVVLLPAFNGLTGKEVSDLLFQKPQIWAGLLVAVVFIGLLAGVYPAFYLSKFQPTDVLKGSYLAGGKSNWLRRVLVVFQFSISLVLIIGSMIVYNQLKYSYSKDLGFSKDQVVVIDNVYNLGKNKALAFKNELLEHSDISSASISGFFPLSGSMSDAPFVRDDASNDTEGAVSMQVWGVDYDYVPTFDMKLVAGRNFNREMASDSAAIVINETAAKKFGYENPVGRKIKVLGDFNHQGKSEFLIVGVIKDFHYESLRSGISPVMLFISKNEASAMSVRLNSENYHETMAFIESMWKEMANNRPFEYRFLDQTFEAKYLSEKKLAIIFSIFSGLAIVIGCLGLFGLSAFTAEKRRKELGIRKVLGASVPNLVKLLFSEFSKLLLLSILLAVPVAWYVMDVWLSNFAFRVPLGVSTFVIASVAVVTIGLLTVSIQSLKAASSNPVDNLKYE